MEGARSLAAIIVCIGVCTVGAISPSPTGTFETATPTLTTSQTPAVSFLHEPYFAVVSENADVGTTVMQVTTSGSPHSSRIQYSIVHNDQQALFKVNETTGVITTSSVIDREAGVGDKSAPRVINLTIQVEEILLNSTLSVTTTVQITVLDVNDNRPTFNRQSYSASISEHAAVRTPVTGLQMTVSDADQGTNSEFRLRLLGDDASVFDVEPKLVLGGAATVSIFVVDPPALDYETLEKPEKILRFLIQATESRTPQAYTAVTEITVHVQDVPEDAMFLLDVRENVRSATVVGTVRRPGDNYIFFYIVGGDNDNTFRLDKRTGETSVINALDRERKSSYTLVVKRTRAADYLVPNVNTPFNEHDESLLKVIVEVEDVNDNSPQFDEIHKYLVVEEDTPYQTSITKLKATDADVEANGAIQYSVDSILFRPRSKNSRPVANMFVEGAFLVRSEDGAVTTATLFDSYLDGHFEVVMRARDGGGLFDTMQINIYVVKRDQFVTLTVLSSHTPYMPSCVGEVFNASNAAVHIVGMRADPPDRLKLDVYVVKTDENIICDSRCTSSILNSSILQQGCSDLAVLKASPESSSWTDLTVGVPILIISLVGAVLFTATFTALVIVCCRYRKNPPKRYRTSSLAAQPRNIPTTERLRSVERRGSTIRRTWGTRSRHGKNRPRIFPPDVDNGVNDLRQHGDNAEGPLEFKVLSKEDHYEEPLFSGVDEDIACSVNDVLIERKWLKLGPVFAKGNFGQVLKGTLKTQVEVAVKTLQGNRQNLNTFLREGIMMRQFNHRNVLGLVGICLHQGEPPMIIIPYMKNGDLLNFIRDSGKDITTKDLIDFGQQIAEGMSYLGGMKYVHRDLAARNCMIDEYGIVKIGDFGLSRDIYEHDYYTSREGGPALPVKWMAIESLTHNVFNTKTDVWAFGVLLWELMTRGVPPYPDVDIYDMADYLLSDRRLRKPEECPTRIYKTMLVCWNKDPNKRPSFKHLARLLEQIKVSTAVDKYVDILNNMPEAKC
ncbi:uncharacterized protein [Branchiostoma lanceolatum]|uniref:uncharacterized protein n=1 Tax=Branchiostoma lanceolatum TaxID=7740 RepID=UPI0034564E90